jgi:hypothetical protein
VVALNSIKLGVFAGDVFYAINHGTVSARTTLTNPIIFKISSADLTALDSWYDTNDANIVITVFSTYYTVSSTLVPDKYVYTFATSSIAATDYLPNMTSVDLLATTPFYIMPDSQRNSVTPNQACRHRTLQNINSAYATYISRHVTQGLQYFVYQFDQVVPFNVTVLNNETGVTFNPGSWFEVSYTSFDVDQTITLTWKLQEMPVFYELSVLYQINIKVRLCLSIYRPHLMMRQFHPKII